jgi:hypothetical protein
MDLSVRFCSSAVAPGFWSAGSAVNMSSGGVLVVSQQPILVGTLVELRIEWPLLLDGRIPLQLVARGRVLRRGTSHFAAAFERHEFRTLRSSSVRPDAKATNPPTPNP